MAQIKKPNTICRNPNCIHGEDGGRKKFYACLTCLRKESWRAYCCSIECYEEYTRIVLDSRSKGNTEPIQPERIDMSPAEVKEVMETPIEQVEEYTREVELKDYFEENPESPLSKIIEKVNADIEENVQSAEDNVMTVPYKSKKRRKSSI